MSVLSGSRIIVTGSASGMGPSVIGPLAEQGARVVGLDINHEDGLSAICVKMAAG